MQTELQKLIDENGDLPDNAGMIVTIGGFRTFESRQMDDELILIGNTLCKSGKKLWIKEWSNMHWDIILPTEQK